MHFYNLDYLSKNQSILTYFGYFAILISLLVGAFFILLYLRNNYASKYRDISLIMLLLVLILTGIQYQKYSDTRLNDTQRLTITSLIKSIAKVKKTNVEHIYINSQTINDNMLVKIANQYYKIELSSDQATYRIVPINLVNKETKIMLNE